MGDGKLGGSGDCENKLKVLWTKIDELPVERTKEVTPSHHPRILSRDPSATVCLIDWKVIELICIK